MLHRASQVEGFFGKTQETGHKWRRTRAGDRLLWTL